MTNRSAVATSWGRDIFGRRVSTLMIIAMMAAVGTTVGAGAYAQAGTEPEKAQAAGKDSDAKLLDDYLHYSKIRRYDVAASRGQELIDRNITNAEFVKLIEAKPEIRGKFEEAVQEGLQNPQAQAASAALMKKYEQGQMERARNSDQIAKNIQELGGTQRAQMLAKQRLVEAGEYAMPQLLEAFLDGKNPALAPKIQLVLRDMGRQAIIPLCVAMMKETPVRQERIADLLALMQYPTSLPFLSDVASTTKVQAVKDAAQRAMVNLNAPAADTATLYRSLAENYYSEKSELTSFPGEEFQIFWDYDPRAGGLMATAIKTPVFHEAMAMSLAERGLAIEAMNGSPNLDTVALWIASNFSREIDTPKDYQNPVYPSTRRSAMYYAVFSGSDVSQRVLARALDTHDTPLARKALVAVEETAGGKNLFVGNGGRMPLLEALTYPSRRVQYEAALALAKARPQQAFAGSDRVVPVLASSIRGATSQYAVVITADAEVYQGMRKSLEAMGYTVLPQGRSLGDLAQPIAEAPAIDLVVSMGLNGDKVPALVGEVRGSNKTGATPVLALTNADSYTTLRHRYATDASVAVRQMGLSDNALKNSVTELLNTSTGGPVSEQEARAYATRSLEALGNLAESGNQVLNVNDAALPLMGALNDPASQDRMKIADILSQIGQERAQRAVLDAAMTAKGEQRVTLLGLTADSAKRFGNMLEVRHVAQIVDLANKGSNEEATAAAALMGALNLPNAELVGMITQKK